MAAMWPTLLFLSLRASGTELSVQCTVVNDGDTVEYVEISGLLVGRTEVTQGAFSSVMGRNPTLAFMGCGPALPAQGSPYATSTGMRIACLGDTALGRPTSGRFSVVGGFATSP